MLFCAVLCSALLCSALFEKSCRPTVREFVENHENLAEMDVRKGNRVSTIAKLIQEGLGMSWDGSRPQNPLPNVEKHQFSDLGG